MEFLAAIKSERKTTTTMQAAFRAALARLAAAGRFAQASPWVHDLARRLAEVGA